MAAVVITAPALAQESTTTQPATTEPAPAKPTSKFRDPEDGQIDLGRFLATPKKFLPIPLVITEPAVGYGGGLAGMFVRTRKQAGEEPGAHSVAIRVTGSTIVCRPWRPPAPAGSISTFTVWATPPSRSMRR